MSTDAGLPSFSAPSYVSSGDEDDDNTTSATRAPPKKHAAAAAVRCAACGVEKPAVFFPPHTAAQRTCNSCLAASLAASVEGTTAAPAVKAETPATATPVAKAEVSASPPAKAVPADKLAAQEAAPTGAISGSEAQKLATDLENGRLSKEDMDELFRRLAVTEASRPQIIYTSRV